MDDLAHIPDTRCEHVIPTLLPYSMLTYFQALGITSVDEARRTLDQNYRAEQGNVAPVIM